MEKILALSPQDIEVMRNEEVTQAFVKEKKRLLNFIRKRIATEEEAEDILQDVFFQLTETFDVLRPIEQLTAWLFRVTRNKIIDRYRKKKVQSLDQEEEFSEGTSAEGSLSPEKELDQNDLWEALSLALAQLPQEQREVFIWHELEEKSFKEMAAMTGVGVNTLLSRKRYAVLSLRKLLRETYNEL
jgi:RNA polymerase sigma factor (sigma-70 family)